MPRRRSTRGWIIQRGKDSWEVGFRAGSGVRVRETVRGSRTDAQRRQTELLREYDMTGLVPDRDATVASFSAQWLDHVTHRVKPTTLKRYRELLDVHIVPVIGTVRMTELRPAAIQAVIAKVLDVRSPRTAVNAYRVAARCSPRPSGGA
jgi:integrase